jgi:ABC-type phosphate/phosphonate transport system substrate-binding protein
MRVQLRILVLLAVGPIVVPCPYAVGQEKSLQVGMAKSFFAATPKVFVSIASKDFADLLNKTTGFSGELSSRFGPDELGQRLKDRKLDFAILHGHEFAMLRKQYPTLQPLLIIDCKAGERAYVIVRQDSNAQTSADLRGKRIDLPLDARQHCNVFFSKLGADNKHEKEFFGSVTKSALQIEALNELANGKIDAVIVDTVGLADYKQIRGPVFTKNLRVLTESEAFPAPVIVYERGALEEKLINQFRDGLLKAHATDAGRGLMKDWKIDSFAPVPKDYEQQLEETLKSYSLSAR